MQRYILQNGWTRASLKQAIRKYNTGVVASLGEDKGCAYLTGDGNRCFVGCCIPADADDSLRHAGDAEDLLCSYPELADRMPFDVDGLLEFQEVHDRFGGFGVHSCSSARVRALLTRGLSLHELADAWIDEACVDPIDAPSRLESTHK